MKIRILILIVAAAFFLAGAFVGFLWAGARFRQLEVSKTVDVAAQAGMDARTLTLLRLNQITNAVDDLEERMDGAVSGLAAWDSLTKNKTIRERRDRWLKPVKAYHKNYPVKTEDAAAINAFLAKIPDRNPMTNAAPQ
jgi:hypothetical protein